MPDPSSDVVLMVSGGLDSFLAASHFPSAKKVFIDWGQPYLSMELEAVADLYPDAHRVTIGGIPGVDSTDPYVPARNLLFACLAARFGTRICFAGMRDEMCADKSPKSFREMSRILTDQCRQPMEVFSPFWGLTKSEAVASYIHDGKDPDVLARTISCYGSGSSPCLDCEACFRRFVALVSNGVMVPRPSSRVVGSYGLHRLNHVPIPSAHSILVALHLTGTPIVPVPVEDVADCVGKSPGTMRIVYSKNKRVAPELMSKVLVQSGVEFDGVFAGAPDSFFDFITWNCS